MPKWLPKGFKVLAEMGPLGGLVDHLGPEAPHIGPKGSKMSQNVPKTIKNRPQINKKHINTRIQNGSQNLAATRFPAHLPLHRPWGLARRCPAEGCSIWIWIYPVWDSTRYPAIRWGDAQGAPIVMGPLMGPMGAQQVHIPEEPHPLQTPEARALGHPPPYGRISGQIPNWIYPDPYPVWD